MYKWIDQYIPNNIETYVEVFGGAFWVYIKGRTHTKFKLKTVVYNDFNRYMTNIFACCRNPDIFHDHMKHLKAQNEKLFYQFKEDIFDNQNIDDIQMPDYDFGMKYAYVLTQIFSGLNPERGKFIELEGEYKSKFDSFRDRLINPKVVNKLHKITHTENLDFQELIEKYDSPTTFFYTDPPYWKTENYYSLNDFDVDDHTRLAKMLQNIDGRFALSYYDFEQLHDWFGSNEYVWERKEFVKPAAAREGGTQTIGEELLIMNYNIHEIPFWE